MSDVERDDRPDDVGEQVRRLAVGLTGRVSVVVLVSVLVFVCSLAPVSSPALALLLALLVGGALWLNARRAYYEDLSSRDTLTGLHNKGAFDADLTRLTGRGRPYVVFFMDVDRFKLINDNHGHSAGDAVLMDFSRSVVRFTQRGDCAYRVGGDEFAVVAPRAMDVAACEAMARGIKAAVEHPVRCGERTIEPKTSVGFARFPQDGATGDAVRDAADAMMYARKEQAHAAAGAHALFDARERIDDFDLYSTMMAAPVPFLVLRVGRRLDLLFANRAALGLVGAADADELLRRSGSSFAALVHADDVERVRNDMAARLDGDEEAGFFVDRFRVVALDGFVRAVESHTVLVRGTRHGDVAYAYLSEAGDAAGGGVD